MNSQISFCKFKMTNDNSSFFQFFPASFIGSQTENSTAFSWKKGEAAFSNFH
jgi:hypothetical protein